jgi:hypothetical protein
MATEKAKGRGSEKREKTIADGYGTCCLCGQEKVRIIVHGKSNYLCRGCVIHVAKSLPEMVRSDLFSGAGNFRRRCGGRRRPQPYFQDAIMTRPRPRGLALYSGKGVVGGLGVRVISVGCGAQLIFRGAIVNLPQPTGGTMWVVPNDDPTEPPFRIGFGEESSSQLVLSVAEQIVRRTA